MTIIHFSVQNLPSEIKRPEVVYTIKNSNKYVCTYVLGCNKNLDNARYQTLYMEYLCLAKFNDDRNILVFIKLLSVLRQKNQDKENGALRIFEKII